jgi:hypothetical protein
MEFFFEICKIKEKNRFSILKNILGNNCQHYIYSLISWQLKP